MDAAQHIGAAGRGNGRRTSVSVLLVRDRLRKHAGAPFASVDDFIGRKRPEPERSLTWGASKRPPPPPTPRAPPEPRRPASVPAPAGRGGRGGRRGGLG